MSLKLQIVNYTAKIWVASVMSLATISVIMLLVGYDILFTRGYCACSLRTSRSPWSTIVVRCIGVQDTVLYAKTTPHVLQYV